VWSKRLEQGRLIHNWHQIRSQEMDWTQLKCLLEGIEIKHRKKRYKKD
jgi:transposase